MHNYDCCVFLVFSLLLFCCSNMFKLKIQCKPMISDPIRPVLVRGSRSSAVTESLPVDFHEASHFHSSVFLHCTPDPIHTHPPTESRGRTKKLSALRIPNMSCTSACRPHNHLSSALNPVSSEDCRGFFEWPCRAVSFLLNCV